MLNFRKIDRHAGLMSRMAAATGADVPGALLTGRLAPENLRAAVLSCTRCDHVAACEAWLDQGGTHRLMPAFCRNGRVLSQIAAQTS